MKEVWPRVTGLQPYWPRLRPVAPLQNSMFPASVTPSRFYVLCSQTEHKMLLNMIRLTHVTSQFARPKYGAEGHMPIITNSKQEVYNLWCYWVSEVNTWTLWIYAVALSGQLLKLNIFWNVVPCCMINSYWCFEGLWGKQSQEEFLITCLTP